MPERERFTPLPYVTLTPEPPNLLTVSRIAVFGLIIPIMNVLLSAILNGEPLFEWQ